jgi:hypothetical protein
MSNNNKRSLGNNDDRSKPVKLSKRAKRTKRNNGSQMTVRHDGNDRRNVIPAPPKNPPRLNIFTPKLEDGSKRKCNTTPCTTCGKPVRGDFAPIYCHRDRNNQDPVSGWGYLHRDEVRCVNIWRRQGWLDYLLPELIRLSMDADMDSLNRATFRLSLEPKHAAPPPPASYRDRVESFDADADAIDDSDSDSSFDASADDDYGIDDDEYCPFDDSDDDASILIDDEFEL